MRCLQLPLTFARQDLEPAGLSSVDLLSVHQTWSCRYCWCPSYETYPLSLLLLPQTNAQPQPASRKLQNNVYLHNHQVICRVVIPRAWQPCGARSWSHPTYTHHTQVELPQTGLTKYAQLTWIFFFSKFELILVWGLNYVCQHMAKQNDFRPTSYPSIGYSILPKALHWNYLWLECTQVSPAGPAFSRTHLCVGARV